MWRCEGEEGGDSFSHARDRGGRGGGVQKGRHSTTTTPSQCTSHLPAKKGSQGRSGGPALTTGRTSQTTQKSSSKRARRSDPTPQNSLKRQTRKVCGGRYRNRTRTRKSAEMREKGKRNERRRRRKKSHRASVSGKAVIDTRGVLGSSERTVRYNESESMPKVGLDGGVELGLGLGFGLGFGFGFFFFF